MEMPQILKLLQDFGIDLVAFAFIAVVSWKLLCWGKCIVDTVMEQAKVEREVWQKAVASLAETMTLHNNLASAFHAQVTEAHKFQREEHEKLISMANESLNAIKLANIAMASSTEARAKEHQSMIATLKGIEEAVGRINGYTVHKR